MKREYNQHECEYALILLIRFENKNKKQNEFGLQVGVQKTS